MQLQKQRVERCCVHGRYGAFALAMILSLAAAIPIVFVCKLPECAKGNPLPVWGRASRFTD